MRAVMLLLVLGAFAAACSGASTQGGEERRAAFSVYINEPQSPLIPTATSDSEGREVIHALFTGLIAYDPETTEPIKAMAESITSDDQRTWTIRIKDGWTFHDGTPVTARSYVNGWNYGAYGPNAQHSNSFFENIEGYDALQCGTNAEGQADCEAMPPKERELSGLKVIDDHTFEVTLSAPFSQFPLTLGYTAFFPVPDALLADPEAFGQAPVGNGPFQMDGQWEHNRQIRTRRFEDYGGEPAEAEAVEFRIYVDVTAAYTDLLANNLDVLRLIPPEQIPAAREALDGRVIERRDGSLGYLGFPLYQEEFQDRRLRVAFSKAIDREAIADAVFDGGRLPAFSLVSPVVPGAREDPCGDYCEYDPAEARQLFEAAGGFDGRLELVFNSGAGHEVWMEAVANQLRQNLGMDAPIFRQYQPNVFFDFLDNEQVTGPFRYGWNMDYPSPQSYLEPLFSTTGSANDTDYGDPRVDSLLAQGNAAESFEQSIAFYRQAEDLVLRDMPLIPLFLGLVQAGYSERVDQVVIDAFRRVDVARVEVVR